MKLRGLDLDLMGLLRLCGELRDLRLADQCDEFRVSPIAKGLEVLS